MNRPLWKISLAVWLPILVLVILSYGTVYAVSLNHAKDNQNTIKEHCQKYPPTNPGNPNSDICAPSNNRIVHGFLYIPRNL